MSADIRPKKRSWAKPLVSQCSVRLKSGSAPEPEFERACPLGLGYSRSVSNYCQERGSEGWGFTRISQLTAPNLTGGRDTRIGIGNLTSRNWSFSLSCCERQITTHSGRKISGQPAPDSPESYSRLHLISVVSNQSITATQAARMCHERPLISMQPRLVFRLLDGEHFSKWV